MKTNRKGLVISFLIGAGVAIGAKKIFQKTVRTIDQDKIGAYYDVLNKWMKLKEADESIEKRLIEKGIKTVAIYGMGDLGRHLKKDLENTEIEVKYAIDRSFVAISDIDIYEPESEMPYVDAIIVAPVYDYKNIRYSLEAKMNCLILNIADIVSDKWDSLIPCVQSGE